MGLIVVAGRPIPVVIRPAFLIIPMIGALAVKLAHGRGVDRGGVRLGAGARNGPRAGDDGLRVTSRGSSCTASAAPRTGPWAPAPAAGQRFLVTFAGPLAGLALGVGLLLIAQGVGLKPVPGSMGDFVVTQAIWVNVVWSVINLLPVLPWDGGWVVDSGPGAAHRQADARGSSAW